MMRIITTGLALLSLFAVAFSSGCSSELTYQSSAIVPPEIALAVDQAMDPALRGRRLVGAAVGIIADGQRYVFGYGSLNRHGGKAVDNRTIFEIGSITKTFTTLVLAQMVLDGKLSLDQPAQGLLPGVTFPEFEGTPITLRHLASHTSGLPYMPSDMGTVRELLDLDLFDDYPMQDLHAWVSSYQLTVKPGTRYEYSNAATALLGQLLAAQAGLSYEELIAQRITVPLGMESTRITLHTADGWLADGNFLLFSLAGLSVHLPMPHWEMPAFEPAGAIVSTVDDMLVYLAAAMGGDTPMRDAFALAAEQFADVAPTLSVGLGWHAHIAADGGAPIIWHNGATGGFTSFLGFVPGTDVGVVILSNTLPGLTGGGVDNEAIQILESLTGRNLVDTPAS